MDSHVCSMVSQAKVVHSFPHVFFPASLEMPYTNSELVLSKLVPWAPSWDSQCPAL